MPSHLANFSTGSKNLKQVKAQIIRGINAGCTEPVRFNHIASETFSQLQDDRSPTKSHCKYIYDFEKRILCVRIPTDAHEALASILRDLINDQLRSAGVLWTKVASSGSPSIKLGSKAAQPDGCFMPIDKRGKTVCIEVGNSQTETGLIRVAHHWLEHPESTILICLLVKLSADKNAITLSVWRPTEHHESSQQLRFQRVHATMTESVKIMRADPDHTVQFTKCSDLHPNEIRLPITAFTGEQTSSAAVENVILDEPVLRQIGLRLWLFCHGFD
ncbi:uncharacterized protein N7515_003738 [Penicillium bovifimosum]|uniref:Uncharacterized protein n=1 Tax=Penicillium bovifimosum TaxID=126998 RepID=A0A9W9H568_9EURO|nr:uncharacterized protein N7515_003738 [Penicillium bovifimosum]KAJ5138890.1 hypothetical protein N7515_003738 [Penicillium bovifimosum]